MRRLLKLITGADPRDLRQAAIISVLAGLAVVLGPAMAMAQSAINVDLGTGAGLSERVVQMVGLLTVLSTMLGDQGVGVVETYVVRTALAAAVCMALFPPRDVAFSDVPRLLGRSVVVTTYFVFVIIGAQTGSPVVVQTLVATTPLIVLVVEAIQRGTLPPLRSVVAAAIVTAGVGLILLA